MHGKLVDARIGFHAAHLRRDDQTVEGIIDAPDLGHHTAQIGKGIAEYPGAVAWTQGTDIVDQRGIHPIAAEESLVKGIDLLGLDGHFIRQVLPALFSAQFAALGAQTRIR